MCGGVNIVYGTKEIEYENSGQNPDPNVSFFLTELEPQEYPLENDLILNVDGCFYKVKTVSEDSIETVRLTLQGTGSGGGGGSSSGPTGGGSYSINVPTSQNVFSSTTDSMPIEFIGYYDGSDNYINYVSFSLGGPVSDTNPAFYEVANAYYAFNTPHTIDLVDYIDEFGSTATSVYINTTDKYGSPRYKKFSIQIVDLSLTMVRPVIFSCKTNICKYTYEIDGAQTGVDKKELVVNFYNEDLTATSVPEQRMEIQKNFVGETTVDLDVSKLPHGTYIMTVTAEAKITGSATIISSNTLTHKLTRFSNTISTPLFTALLPERLEQFTSIPLDYLLTSKEDNKVYTLSVLIDGIEQANLNIKTNALSQYSLYFEDKGNYNLTLNIVELGLSWNKAITITEYNGILPVIRPDNPSLMLYLTPRGQSNNSTTRDSWPDYNGRYTAKLENFHYSDSNGWLQDEDGTPYLALNSGGKLTIPDFYPFAEDPTVESTTNQSMGSGMTIELDFEIDGITDYDAELIKCISLNVRDVITVGFTITGNKVTFYSGQKNGQGNNGVLSSLTLAEGRRVRLSFVIEPNKTDFPLFTSYLNGITSGVSIYDTDDSFIESSSQRAQLIVDSTYAQIKLYGIRFYTTALKDNIILENYTASLPTLEAKQSRFDSNNVYTGGGDISYEIVSSEGYNLEIPYMVLTGGWKTDAENDKWKMLDADKVGAADLPSGKKDYRLVDVKVVYPNTPYFKDYKNYSYTNTFDNGLGMRDNFGSRANNGGCIMYAQGTSSLEYPIKNLRLRWKKEKDFYTVKPDIDPVEIICMKADYMESSGSHNTGAANLVDDLYAGIGIKSPGQKHFGPQGEDDKTHKRIVTCIKGHPCLIFWSPTGEKGTYEYVGKYNLNLDKATPEPFGFNHDDEFGWLPEGTEYWEVAYADKNENYKDPFIGQLEPTEGADYVPGQTETSKLVGENDKVNAIHCFEFLDNATEVCNFLPKAKAYIEDENGNLVPDPNEGYYSYEETWYNGFEKENKIVPGWTLGFESRYPEDRVGYHDADMLYPLASWLNELYTLKTDLNQPEVALQRFKDEYQRYLDKNFLIFYYVVTEALLMADNRVKNMMIATWGPEERTYSDTAGQQHTFTDYIWYPIFYDMDTMLGLDNTGVNRFTYFDEDTNPSVYNGKDVLWDFVRDALPLEINEMYGRLEKVALHIDIEESGEWAPSGVINYFNKNQANMANEAFYNADAKYKYIDPAQKGYFDGLHNEPIPAGAAPFLYAAQGDRSLMREDFIVNRIKFLRGKHNSDKFKTSDRIDFRWYYPTGAESEFAGHELSVTKVQPTIGFDFTSLQTCYAGAVLGANNPATRERFDGEETKTIVVPGAAGANGTEAYLLGISNLKDLGDLSAKYPQKFWMMGDNKLRRLTLGNPSKHYYNPYWGNAINLAGCNYLQHFNLQNCITYNFALDFTACPIIETILLTGSSPNVVKLPTNGMLTELRLPTSLKALNINSHRYLTDEGFSIGGYVYGPEEKIGANDGSYYTNDYGYLQDICIIDTPINTYDMVTQAVSLESYYFQNFTWRITGEGEDDQYVTTSDPYPGVNGKAYYVWKESEGKYGQASLSDRTEAKWGRIKERVKLINNGEITCIPILEQLLTKAPKKDGSTVTHASALTGEICLAVPGVKVNQFALYDLYHDKYPNVTITYDKNVMDEDDVIAAHNIEFFNIVNVSDESEPYFSVLTNGNYTLNQLISEDGPAGINMTMPVLPSTATNTYRFTRSWKDVAANPPVVYNMDTDFNHKPTKDMRLEPIFETLPRTYPVTFYDYEGKNPIVVHYDYNQIMSQHPDTPLFRNRLDDLPDWYNRYTFQGWISEADFNNLADGRKPTIINLNTTHVTYETMKLYPYYTIEDCRAIASNIDYFDFKEQEVEIRKTIPGASVPSIMKLTQYVVNIHPDYVEQLSGKITFPTTDKKGRKVTAIGKMRGESTSQITHVFFLADSEYEVIGANDLEGFYGMSNLQRVYFPENYNSMKYFNANSFNMTSALTTIDNLPSSIEYIGEGCFYNSAINIDVLPSNLQYLGGQAFQFCRSLAISNIPDGVTYILTQTFYGCENILISNFGHEMANNEIAAVENNLSYIAEGAFHSAGKNVSAVTIHNSITELEEKAFNNFGSYGVSVRDNTGLITLENIHLYFGSEKSPTLNENY